MDQYNHYWHGEDDLPCLPWVHAFQWVPVKNNKSVIDVIGVWYNQTINDKSTLVNPGLFSGNHRAKTTSIDDQYAQEVENQS